MAQKCVTNICAVQKVTERNMSKVSSQSTELPLTDLTKQPGQYQSISDRVDEFQFKTVTLFKAIGLFKQKNKINWEKNPSFVTQTI